MLRPIPGGITAPAGFRTAGVSCGIKRRTADAVAPLDLAMLAADRPVAAAAVFTTNKAVAAPVVVSRDHLARSGGRAQVIVTNSGCANACTGHEGLRIARAMATASAESVGCATEHAIVASTGVIGVPLSLDKVRRGIDAARQILSVDLHEAAAQAIMTTDPFPKSYAVVVDGPDGPLTIGGMAKGSGMIEPRMATMLGYLTTDAVIDPAALDATLRLVVDRTFNAISVDGEPSTNDAVFALASGASGTTVGLDDPAFIEGLLAVSEFLAREIVRGGEGATKLISVQVTGAASDADARLAVRAIANSPLVKTAIHGCDPNWGRLVSAAGRSGAAFELDRASVAIGPVALFVTGVPHDERAEQAATVLAAREVSVTVDLGTDGNHQAQMWTCDLSAEYVRINAEYRT